MGRRFAALGVDVVYVVVEGQLIPGFRHLQQVVAPQHFSDDAGFPAGHPPEIMGQLELFNFIAVGPYQILHDGQEHPCGVLGQGAGRGVQHFVTQRAQGVETILQIPGFQRLEEVDDGVGDAKPPGFGQFLDAMGMEPWKQAFFADDGRCGPAQYAIDDLEKISVALVEK